MRDGFIMRGTRLWLTTIFEINSWKGNLSVWSIRVSISFEESGKFTLGDGLLAQGTGMTGDSWTILRSAWSNGPFIDGI